MKFKNIIIISLIPLLFLIGNYRSNHNKSKDIGIWKEISENTKRGVYYRYRDSIYIIDIFYDEKIGYRPDFFKDSLFMKIDPISDVDIKSFKICQGTVYAKDKNYIYYPLDRYRMSRYSETTLFRRVKLEYADRASFKYLGYGYAVDKNNMYYNGRKIQWNNRILKEAVRYYSNE